MPQNRKKMKLVLLGAGGFAREALCWINPREYEVLGLVSEGAQPGETRMDLPVLGSFQGLSGRFFLPCVGNPKTKMILYQKAVEAGMIPCPPIIHESAVIGRGVSLSPASIVCPQSVITQNVQAGFGLLMNLGCTLGHDCRVGAFVTLSPGCNVSGNCHLEDRTYLGTNSVLREGLHLGKDSVLGMGAVLTKDIPTKEVWIGNPARKLEK